ncbi:hypothetical protein [Methylocystis hirsuta]
MHSLSAALRISDQRPAVVHALPRTGCGRRVPDANTIWTFREAQHDCARPSAENSAIGGAASHKQPTLRTGSLARRFRHKPRARRA